MAPERKKNMNAPRAHAYTASWHFCSFQAPLHPRKERSMTRAAATTRARGAVRSRCDLSPDRDVSRSPRCEPEKRDHRQMPSTTPLINLQIVSRHFWGEGGKTQTKDFCRKLSVVIFFFFFFWLSWLLYTAVSNSQRRRRWWRRGPPWRGPSGSRSTWFHTL